MDRRRSGTTTSSPRSRTSVRCYRTRRSELAGDRCGETIGGAGITIEKDGWFCELELEQARISTFVFHYVDPRVERRREWNGREHALGEGSLRRARRAGFDPLFGEEATNLVRRSAPSRQDLSLIHISEPTRLLSISYA